LIKRIDKLDPSIIEKNGCQKNGKESIKIISKTPGIPDGVTIFVDGKRAKKN
jgi:hypothetical protein